VETANWRGLEPFALPGISGDETVTLSHESEMANQPSKAASAGLEPRISVVVLEVRMGVTPMRGVFFSNRHVDVRISDLHNHMDVRFGDMENRFEARFAAETRVNDANFRLVLSKIDDLDVRLTRLEERFAR
jgi:hypothetical protein